VPPKIPEHYIRLCYRTAIYEWLHTQLSNELPEGTLEPLSIVSPYAPHEERFVPPSVANEVLEELVSKIRGLQEELEHYEMRRSDEPTSAPSPGIREPQDSFQPDD